MKFTGESKAINIKTTKPEFIDWKWIDTVDLPKVAVKFKINIYKKIVEELVSSKLN